VFGRRVRNLFSSKFHQNIFGCTVSQESGAAGRWETTEGGEYFAAGVDGAIAGRRAHLGIIDDPVKNRADADSETRRRAVWDWYQDDFSPRLVPSAAQILVQTRWHEDDLAGRILEREADEWRVVSLPMEAMPGDLLGRPVGERLWPEWFTEEQVERAKRDVRSWNALYQQQPASEEGDYFKSAWFGEWQDLPETRTYFGASDYAVTEGAGDYTEHGIFALDQWDNIYVVDWWSGQTASDVWIERQCDLIIQYNPAVWFGESGVIKRAIEPMLYKRLDERDAICRFEWLPSISEKTARARPFQQRAAMGKVFLPRNARWKADFIGQMTRFPAGKFDDKVDTCSLIGRGMEDLKTPRRRRKVEEYRAPVEPGEGREQWLAS
jgi:predicted phage terminase large subunit-like protein